MSNEDTRTLHADALPESLKVRKYWLSVPGGTRECFDRRTIYVGSAPDNAFVIEDPTVSRVHLKIEADRVGHRLRDLDSKNGTFVNGIRVTDVYLPPECRVRIGATEFEFRLGDESVEVQLATRNRFGAMLGESLDMREIFALLARVAPTMATVLVEGESGTGKELIAEALHREGQRPKGPFVIFDCSAVPRDLVESELFGHTKGAFTGATGNRIGAFEEASGGTLFLDEIGELPMDLQPKLLRALESKEVKPVGSNTRVKVNCRIVAATNRNLEKEVQASNFREDLYYRLAVIKVRLPPLRNRPEDIPLLVNHFVDQVREGYTGTAKFQISYETMQKLQRHPWPGNVRELRNFVERAVLLADEGRIDTRFIGAEGAMALRAPVAAPAPAPVGTPAAESTSAGAITIDYTLPYKDAKDRLTDEFERVYWTRLLAKTSGNISEAARRGGIHRKSLEYLLKKLDVG
ncbi:MAG: sigma 54-dependent Fis family transcriptional regulator [Myxococcales bacterium]|nr:sigma 54-dependent Fis family transcriptional regulator [Myxococcales bacterium]